MGSIPLVGSIFKGITGNSISEVAKNLIAQRNFPRFVWVTEYGTLESLNSSDYNNRKIIGHIVIDATSSIYWENSLLAHFPGFLFLRDHKPAQPSQISYFDIYPLNNDDSNYLPRRRVD